MLSGGPTAAFQRVSMLSIIVPVYNERATLALVLARIGRVLPDVGKEIVIVDDCSTDGTREWLRSNFAQDRHSGSGIEIDPAGQVVLVPSGQGPGITVQVEYHEHNRGKGAALQSGLAVVTGDVIVIQDADLEYDPDDWTEMYDLIAVRKVADVVYGSRFYGRPHRSLYFHHYLANRLISFLFNTLYNQTLTDVEVCYKMFSREVKDGLRITCDDFGFEIQISAQISLARRWRIYEIGIRYFGRTYEEGKKINWKDGLKALWYLLRFRFSRPSAAHTPSSSARPPGLLPRRVAVWISLGLFALLLTVFAASPVKTPFDSRWSIHTAMSFVQGRGGDLTEYLPLLKKHDFYAINYPDGRPRARYPIGTSLLAVPAVVVGSWFDPSFAEELRSDVPAKFEQVVASMIGAVAGVVFFWVILSQFQSLAIALASTFIFSFCTSIWSTATRALWQHGPLVLMLVIAMLLLVRARQRPGLIQFVSLPLAMAYVIRPTAIVPIAMISTYVLVYHRAWFKKYVGWAMLIAIPWVGYNFAVHKALLPPYYSREAFSQTTVFAEGLLGNLFSPSRGLLVFSPVLFFALSGFVLALRDPAQRPLNMAYGAIVVAHLIIVGAGSMWWAGHSFGPRFTTDIVPFLVYFTAFNFRLPATFRPQAQIALSSYIAVLALVSLLIHAQGALRPATLAWNVVPNNIDQNTSRAWDWSDPQFARTNAYSAAR
jgi:glycosyltransferase involved in cell wall biosynthesis